MARRRRRYRSRLTNRQFYGERLRALHILGFNTYYDYLASQLWRDVRACLLRESNNECELCGAEATQVHHQRYTLDDMVGNRLDNLVTVCADCHRAVEYDARGVKRTGPAAVRTCRAMIKRRLD